MASKQKASQASVIETRLSSRQRFWLDALLLLPAGYGTYVLNQRVWPVLGQDHDIKDIRIDTIRERKIDDAVFTGERHRRFGPQLG